MRDNLSEIRAFVAVYEEASFTAAARRTGATQSGISQKVHKLEAKFDVRLFERGTRSVKATPAAHAYYRSCVDVLKRFETANEMLQSFVGGFSGSIAAGIAPVLTRTSLAPAMLRFMESHPNMAVRVVEAYSPILLKAVLEQELDFAIIPSLPGRSGLDIQHFATSFETFVQRRTTHNAQYDRKPVRLGELGPIRVVLPGMGNARRTRITPYFETSGARILQILEMDAMMGTLDFVSKSDWGTIVPAITMTGDVSQMPLISRPLSDPMLGLEFVVATASSRGLTRPAETFVSFMKQEASNLSTLWHATA